MSSSALPRLYFDGHFYWNPSTNNNDDYAGSPTPLIPYDPKPATPNWPWLKTQHSDGEPVTAGNYRRWSWDARFALDSNQSLPPAEWNFFGGMECGFVTDEQPHLEQPPNPDQPGEPVFSKPTGSDTTTITGFSAADGSYSNAGAPVGLELQFNTAPQPGPFAASPKLIDIDPTSPFTSQVYADDFRLGDGTNGFAGPLTQRLHSRWLYFNRNLNQDNGLMIAGIASTVFQSTLAKEDIEWAGDAGPLAELRAAAEQGRGVMLRMVAYDTRYFNGPYFGAQGANQFPAMLKIRNLYVQYFNDLEMYRKGLLQEPPPPPCNRAYSRVVGWLGVWDHGDLETIPGGRVLLPAIMPNQQPVLPRPQTLQPQAVVGDGSGYPFGPATVERDADFTRITVDLCSTIPELDSSGRIAPFGPIELGIELEGTYQRLVTVVPDSGSFEADYRRTAGLIDIASTTLAPVDGQPLTPSQFDSNPLVLKATSYTFDKDAPPSQWTANTVVALTENPLNAQTNTRGMYADEPDALQPGPTSTFTVEVRDFGAIPSAQTGLVIAQYDEAFAALSGDDRALLVFYRAPSGDWLPIDSDTVVDATAGSVTLGVRGAAAAVNGALPYLFFYPVASELLDGRGLSPAAPVKAWPDLEIPVGGGGPPVSPTAGYYAAFRLQRYQSPQLAEFEQFLAGNPGVEEVNNWVFANVYETFHLMYPVMDFIGTPQRFQEWRGRILQVTDPEDYFTAGYMPPTRTLSAAQRRILERYDQYLSGVHAPGSPLRQPSPTASLLRRS